MIGIYRPDVEKIPERVIPVTDKVQFKEESGKTTVVTPIVKEDSPKLVIVLTDKIIQMSPAPCFSPFRQFRVQTDNLIRDIVFCTVPGKQCVLPTAPESCIKSSGLKFDAGNFPSLCKLFELRGLVSGLYESMNTQAYIDYWSNTFSHMLQDDLDDFRTTFYTLAFGIPRDVNTGVLQIKPATGIAASYPKEDRTTEIRNYAIGRSHPIKEDARCPDGDLKMHLQILSQERAVRGENNSKSNYFGQFTYRGTFATKDRLQMCDTISLLMSYRQVVSGDVWVALPPSHLLDSFCSYLASSGFSNVKVRMEDGYDNASSKYPNFVVRGESSQAYFLDMRGNDMPTVSAKEDISEKWCKELEKGVNYSLFKGYVAKRKVPPAYMLKNNKLRFFKFQSSHAFDCLVTNVPMFDYRMVRKYYFNDKDIKFVDEKLALESIRPGEWQKMVFADSRYRTFAYLNRDYRKIDFGLNLWGIRIDLSKKDRNKRAREFVKDEEFVELDIALFKNPTIKEIDFKIEEPKDEDEFTDAKSHDEEENEGRVDPSYAADPEERSY